MDKYVPTWQAWYNKAAKDLRVAKLLLDQEDNDYFEDVVFHAQQCVEKSIKGYLSKNKIRFGKTHDIKSLLELIRQIDSQLANELSPSEVLTRYAVAIRYPEETEANIPLVIDKKLARDSHKLANWIFEELKALL